MSITGQWAAVGAAMTALSVTLSGCGGQSNLNLSEDEFAHAAGGNNAQVGEVLLRDVSIDEPAGTTFEAGDIVRLKLTLFNEAEQADALVSVSTAAASAEQILVDRDCDGTPEVVGEVPLPPKPPLRTPDPAVPDGPEVNYRVLLRLDKQLPSGSFVPVTFTFRNAGATTVQVPVERPDTPLRKDDVRCEPADALGRATS